MIHNTLALYDNLKKNTNYYRNLSLRGTEIREPETNGTKAISLKLQIKCSETDREKERWKRRHTQKKNQLNNEKMGIW